MDLHGYTLDDALGKLDQFIKNHEQELVEYNIKSRKVKIITGKGNGSKFGPILKPAVEANLTDKGYNPVLCKDGGAFIIVIESDSYNY